MELPVEWTMYSDADSDILYGQDRGFQLIALTLGKVSFVREKKTYLTFIYDSMYFIWLYFISYFSYGILNCYGNEFLC